MHRLATVDEKPYDLLVVGAGIYGAAMAQDAALRGLRVILVDSGDFGAATSANSLKIMHGGLRQLRYFDFAGLRRSAVDQQRILDEAGDLAAPLSCVTPSTPSVMGSTPVLRTGIAVNTALTRHYCRQAGLSSSLDAGRVVSAVEMHAIAGEAVPSLRRSGALWNDVLALNPERMLLRMVLNARDHGARVLNYVRLERLQVVDGAITGAELVDTLHGERATIKASAVVNAAGPWVNETLASSGAGLPPVFDRVAFGMNLVLGRQLFKDHAVGLMAPPGDGQEERLLFFVPWHDRTMVGSYYRDVNGTPGQVSVEERDITEFLASINRACPSAQLKRDDVVETYAGLLPATPETGTNGEPELHRRSRVVDHGERDGVPGLFSVLGVKYVTARAMAESAVDAVQRHLGQAPARPQIPPRRVDLVASEACIRERVDAAGRSLDASLIQQLARSHGDAAALLDGAADLLAPIADGCEVLGAEIAHAVKHEAALRLSDVVYRRTGLATLQAPDGAALTAAAKLMARELNWNAARVELEVEAARTRFESVPAGPFGP